MSEETESTAQPAGFSAEFRREVVGLPRAEVEALALAAARRQQPQFQARGFRAGRAPVASILNENPEMIRKTIENLLPDKLEAWIARDGPVHVLWHPCVGALPEGNVEGLPGEAGSSAENYLFLAEYTRLPSVFAPDFSSWELERLEVADSPEAVGDWWKKALAGRRIAGPQVDRPARDGDVVSAEWSARVGKSLVPMSETGLTESHPSSPNALARSLLEQVVGRAAGDVIRIERRLPDKVEDPRLRGRKCMLEARIVGVHEARLPGIDEETAEELGYSSLQAMTETATARYRRAVRHVQRNYLLAQLYGRLMRLCGQVQPEHVLSVAARIKVVLDDGPAAELNEAGKRDEDEEAVEAARGERPRDDGTPEEAVEGAAAAQPSTECRSGVGSRDETVEDPDASYVLIAENVLRFSISLAAVARSWGISVDNADMQRAVAGWALEKGDRGHSQEMARAAENLRESEALRKVAWQRAIAEKLLDEVLARCRFARRELDMVRNNDVVAATAATIGQLSFFEFVW